MNYTLKLFTILSALLTAIPALYGNDCIPPSRNLLVNDYTNTLSQNQVAELEQQLVVFSRETSNQIVVVITNDLCDYEAMEYATEIGHEWGVGLNEFDNGIVLLVSPQQRETFIAVGYGLEGAIPDAIARRIVDQELLPHFRNDDYYGGVSAATNVLMQLAKGEINAADYGNRKGESPGMVIAFVIILFILIIFIGPTFSAMNYSKVNNMTFWAALAIIMASRNSHGGMYNNFNSGSGRFGGGSSFGGGGSSFGGFGGGGFGGGGAGGRW